jgi:hypothetical protein
MRRRQLDMNNDMWAGIMAPPSVVSAGDGRETALSDKR